MTEFITEYAEYLPWIVLALLLASGFGIPIGEDIVIIPAGVIIGEQMLGAGIWVPTLIAAVVGVATADMLWFTWCSKFGTRLLHRRFIRRFLHPKRLLQAKHQIDKRGAWFIVAARFIPGSRTPAIRCRAHAPGVLEIRAGDLVMCDCDRADAVRRGRPRWIRHRLTEYLRCRAVDHRGPRARRRDICRRHRVCKVARTQSRATASSGSVASALSPGLAPRRLSSRYQLGSVRCGGILRSMRAVITGQIGIDKKPYLEQVRERGGAQGKRIELYNVGNMMYQEGPDVRSGRILDLPLSRLASLRRAAFKDIIAETTPAVDCPDLMVNTHATFRWRHGLFSAFDFDQMEKLQPNMFVCLLDNIEMVHHRLHAEHDIDATLKDCMVWREEEILATELLANAMGCADQFYILSRGRQQDTIDTCLRLVTRPDMKRVYPSFPMSHVMDMPDVLDEIGRFRDALAQHFITFDPADVDEKLLLDRAIEAAKTGEDWIDVTPHAYGGREGVELRVRVREVLDIAGDVDGQIYMRDFKLIDQSDMIVSLVPELPGGIPGLSSGVERELQHAWEHTKEVYVVWKPSKPPSPFITETATKIFPDVDSALEFFESERMFAPGNLFGH